MKVSKNKVIISLATVFTAVAISQGAAWYLAHSDKQAYKKAVTAVSLVYLGEDTAASFYSYADKLVKESAPIKTAVSDFQNIRKFSPFFVSKADVDQAISSKKYVDDHVSLSRRMAAGISKGNTPEAVAVLKGVVSDGTKDNQTFIAQQAYRQLGIVGNANMKTTNDIADILSNIDRSIPDVDPGTTLLDIATNTNKYTDYKLYSILDGKMLGIYADSLDMDKSNYSKEQKVLQLEIHYTSLLTKFLTPVKAAKFETDNKIAFAYAHFQLARVDFLLGDLTAASKELATAKAINADMQSVDSRYGTLVGLLAGRGQTIASATQTTKPASAKPANNAQCTSLTAEMNTALGVLGDQVNAQLAYLKQLAANQGTARTIQNGALMGHGATRISNEGSMTASFNSANAKADTLITQYGAMKDQYRNKLLGAGCPL